MNLETCARRAAEYLEQATHFLAAGETPGNFFLAARAAQAAADWALQAKYLSEKPTKEEK